MCHKLSLASNRQVCVSFWFALLLPLFGSDGKFMLYTSSSAAIFAQMVCVLFKFSTLRVKNSVYLWWTGSKMCALAHITFSVSPSSFSLVRHVLSCTEEEASLISACFIRQVDNSLRPILIQNSDSKILEKGKNMELSNHSFIKIVGFQPISNMTLLPPISHAVHVRHTN